MPVSIAGDGTITGFDAGASGFGGLVAVKHALFTGTQSASTAAGANFAVTDLSITHTLADASNKLIISAFFGAASSSFGAIPVGIGVADDGTLIAVGGTSGDRTPVSAGGASNNNSTGDSTGVAVSMPSITFVYEPGDTSSHIYTVRAINVRPDTRTIYINRSATDADDELSARASSALVIQEVAV
jgi:hypothetical protein